MLHHRIRSFLTATRFCAFLRPKLLRSISLILIFNLLALAMPGAPEWSVVKVKETAQDVRYAYLSSSFSTSGWTNSILAFISGERKSARISRIEILPADITLTQGETVNLAATAYSNDVVVPAVLYRWTQVAEGQEVRGFPNGAFKATRPGRYIVTATGNGVQGQTTVTVYPNEGYGIQKKLQQNDSERTERDREIIQRLIQEGVITSRNVSSKNGYSVESESQRSLADAQRREAVLRRQEELRQRNPDPFQQSLSRSDDVQNSADDDVAPVSPGRGGPRVIDEVVSVPPVANVPAKRLMDVVGWDDTNWWTADDPVNFVGNPPGSAPNSGASNGNFRLSAPVLSLSGRGLDVNLALTYNSRLWSKSGTRMTYDADDGFPAPGWNIGFGKMVYTGANGGCMLVTPDGTRRSYSGSNTTYSAGSYYYHYFDGYSTDSSLINYGCLYTSATWGTYFGGSAILPNGTRIEYGSPTADYKQVYPTKITDAQGNFITITYVNNRGPRINTITDTLGRVVTFNYDSSNRLINITGPGYNNTTRTFVRLTYAQKTLSYAFASGYTTSTPSNTPHLIDAIYYPETNTGYWFGDNDSYSSYGMIAKVQSQRGMSWSGSSGTQGTITDGTVNREEAYNFTMTANNTLTDAPGYTLHTETWDRMDTDPAETEYDVTTSSGTQVITVTRPDGSKSKQSSHMNPSNWNDGMFFQNEILSPSDDVLSKTKIFLAQGSYGTSRPTKIETTDELGQMTKTEFTYGTNYNQVTAQKEFDYSGTLYRESRYTYENNAAYTNRHIFNLVKTAERYDASNNRLSRIEYQYDNNAVVNGTTNHGLVAAENVVQHDFTSDPYTTETIYIEGYCNQWEYEYPECDDWTQWVYVGEWPYMEIYCPDHRTCVDWVDGSYDSAYNPMSLFRGNVTKVTTYADAATPSGAISYNFTYDITGNQITAATSCCQETSFSYSTSTQFSKPDTVTKGAADPQSPLRMTVSATYDFNTGAVKTSTNTNGRTTTIAYDAVARPILVTAPTGAKTTMAYDDANWKPTRTMQNSDNSVVSKTRTEIDGRGQPVVSGYFVDATNLNNTAIKYDEMGRKKKISMPYASSGSPVYWTEYTYDHLSRVTQVTAPDGSTSKTFYNEDPGNVDRPDSASSDDGQTVRSQDAWGRERWARTDAFGRLVEVVEPNPAGNGSVEASGSLKTSYSYNESDELIGTAQGSQTRYFAYDSLGRLTRQKLAEQTATINDAGIYVGSGGIGATWSDAFVYDSRSNIIQRTDARGVKTNFSYEISSNLDPLNRLQGVSYDASTADTTHTINTAPAVSLEYMTTGDKTRVKKVITSGIAIEENAYDVEGRITDYTLTFASRTNYPMVTSYQYDTVGRLAEIRYPKQYGMIGDPRKLIGPAYDYASRLVELFAGDVELSDISYNTMGQVTQLKVTEGTHEIVEEYGYDAQTGLLTSQYVYQTGFFREIMSLEYGYSRGNSAGTLNGKTGQLTQMTNHLDRNKDRVYEHDALGRLVKAKGGLAAGATSVTANWIQEYAYDRYGNKTGTTKTGVDKYNNAVSLDGLPSVSYSAASNRINATGWEYDLSGNLIRGQNENGIWQKFEYDAAGRLVKIKDDSDNVIETHTYGADRSRLITETSAQRTYYEVV